MTLVRVELQDVICRDSEDVTGADEFYLIGGVAVGNVASGIVTVPVGVSKGQTSAFVNGGGGEVFKADVPSGEVLKLGLVAYDEDSNKDWSKHGDLAKKIGGAVSGGLAAVPFPWARVAAIIVPIAVDTAGTAMTMDKDDQLGTYSSDEPITGLLPGANPRQWSFKGQWGRWHWWSGWDYTVRYVIRVG